MNSDEFSSNLERISLKYWQFLIYSDGGNTLFQWQKHFVPMAETLCFHHRNIYGNTVGKPIRCFRGTQPS